MSENIAERMQECARKSPHQRAIIFPAGRDSAGRITYSHLTFQQLDQESDRLARGLTRMGVGPGTRMVLMVRPSLEFIALTFALFKTGAVIVLIDPGMGRSNIFRCLEEVEPAGFVAIPIVQAIRILNRGKFRDAKLNVTVGRRWFWGGPNYSDLLGEEWSPFEIPDTSQQDPAAIIFTSGSTGPPKGVLYEHGMFSAQVDLLRDFYNVEPGEIDLPGFPLFALFNSAMGVTTAIPDMDPTKPAKVDPKRIITAINDLGVTQAFGSPAMWNRIGRYCEERQIQFPSLRRILSAGAPVPVHVIKRIQKTLVQKGADIHTPYGATESLPVCSISGSQVLEETASLTSLGAGTCVGTPFPNVLVKVITTINEPISTIDDIVELPTGEIGEILVRAPSTTQEYFRRTEATAAAKIADSSGRSWHRMGDVGYFDEEGRLWFCGRKAHIVETDQGWMYPVRCEAIFNEHPDIYRSALVGFGEKPHQEPVIITEPEQGRFPKNNAAKTKLESELRELAAANPLTAGIDKFLFHRSLPVDTRHNVKIFREKLAPWAAEQISSLSNPTSS